MYNSVRMQVLQGKYSFCDVGTAEGNMGVKADVRVKRKSGGSGAGFEYGARRVVLERSLVGFGWDFVWIGL